MLVADTALLCCVDCGGDLTLLKADTRGEVLLSGLLGCVDCDRRYPVVDEVGIFFTRGAAEHYLSAAEQDRLVALGLGEALGRPATLDEGETRQLEVARNWEYQWTDVCPLDPGALDRDDLFGARAFWEFIPIAPEAMRGKTVFIGCGGNGREVYHVSKAAPARIIVNEIGREIHVIRHLVPDSGERLMLLRGDLTTLPLKTGVCDVALCDHALQHVLDHRRAFAGMAELVRAGGLVSVCVYSHENNSIMTHLVEPAKRLLWHLSARTLRAVAFLPAVVVHLLGRGLYAPLCSRYAWAKRRLPLASHMLLWAAGKFSTVWCSCFDLLHAPISYHFRRREVASLAEDNGLEVTALVNTNKTLWSLVASKPAGRKAPARP